MTAIACAGTGGLRAPGDEDQTPIKLGAIYDTGDPLAWSMWFGSDNNRVFWTFGRDLLIDAMGDDEWHGDGDVGIRRVGQTLWFDLSSPDGHVLVVTMGGPILSLVRQSILLVAPGAEDVDVDAAIARCLAGEAA